MKLRKKIFKNEIVENKCRTIRMEDPWVVFLVNDGTQVRAASRIEEYECLTLQIQERFAAVENDADDSVPLESSDSEDIDDDSDFGGEDSEDSEERRQGDI